MFRYNSNFNKVLISVISILTGFFLPNYKDMFSTAESVKAMADTASKEKKVWFNSSGRKAGKQVI